MFLTRILALFMAIVLLWFSACFIVDLKRDSRAMGKMRLYLQENKEVDVVRFSDFMPCEDWDSLVIFIRGTPVDEIEKLIGFSLPKSVKRLIEDTDGFFTKGYYWAYAGFLLISGKEVVYAEMTGDFPLYGAILFDPPEICIYPYYYSGNNLGSRLLTRADAVFYVDRITGLAETDFLELYPYVDVLEWRDAS